MYRKTEKQLEECYKHMEPYLKHLDETKELREMCKECNNYCGKKHNYEKCKDKWCFKFYLGWKYLEWANSFGGFGT